MKNIAITGKIGSGKSFISTVLNEVKNIPIFNCDTVVKNIMVNGIWEINDIKKLFSANPYIVDDNGLLTLNKEYISNEIFSDPKKREQIESIIHGSLYSEISHFIYENKHDNPDNPPFVLIEAANIIDSPIMNLIDIVVYVDAPSEVREERVINRGLSKEEFHKRNDAQSNMFKNLSNYITIHYINEDRKPIVNLYDEIIKTIIAYENSIFLWSRS